MLSVIHKTVWGKLCQAEGAGRASTREESVCKWKDSIAQGLGAGAPHQDKTDKTEGQPEYRCVLWEEPALLDTGKNSSDWTLLAGSAIWKHLKGGQS